MGKCRCEGQDEGDGHPTHTVGRGRFISARRIVMKNSSRRMKDEEIYASQTEGEEDLCHTGVRCNVLDVQISTGLRAKNMLLERHM